MNKLFLVLTLLITACGSGKSENSASSSQSTTSVDSQPAPSVNVDSLKYAAAIILEGGTVDGRNQRMPLWQQYICLESGAGKKKGKLTLDLAKLSAPYESKVNANGRLIAHTQISQIELEYRYRAQIHKENTYTWSDFEFSSVGFYTPEVIVAPPADYRDLIGFDAFDINITRNTLFYTESKDYDFSGKPYYVSYRTKKVYVSGGQGIAVSECEAHQQETFLLTGDELK